MTELQKAEKKCNALRGWGVIPDDVDNYITKLEKSNTEMREALEFYIEYKNDSRNMGIITTKIKEVLNE